MTAARGGDSTDAIFNYPTLAVAYKVATLAGLTQP
jgi:hypothetical protein